MGDMPTCEDFPACGHEAGFCPSRDSNGRQLDMKCCGCGCSLPLSSPASICNGCSYRMSLDDDPWREEMGGDLAWDDPDAAEEQERQWAEAEAKARQG